MGLTDTSITMVSEAFEYLRALCGPDGKAFLVAIPPDKGPRVGQWISLETDEDLKAFLATNSDANIYYQVQVVDDSFNGIKPATANIVELHAIHVDLDPPKDGGSIEESKKKFAAVVEKLTDAGCAPSAVIDSGGGYQLVWFIEPIPANDENKTAIETANHQLACALGGDVAAKDIARLLRLPETTNHPDKCKRNRGRVAAPTRLIEMSDGLHKIAQIVKIAQLVGSDLGLSRPTSEVTNQQPTKLEHKKAQEYLRKHPSDLPKALQTKLDDALFGSQKLLHRWTGSTEGLRETSRSEMDMSVASLLAEENFSSEEIALILRNSFEHGKGEDGGERYFIHTACKAVSGREARLGGKLDTRLTDLNAEFFVAPVGAKTMVCRVKDSQLEAMSPSSFRDLYVNERYRVGKRWVTLGAAWFEYSDRRQYLSGVTYCPPGISLPPETFNLWTGLGIEPKAGNCQIILSHIAVVLAAGDPALENYILNWLAHLVQRPHEKPGVALVFRSTEGTGKSLFTRLASRVVGEHNTVMSSSSEQVVGRFNGHLMNKLLIVGEEAFFAGDPRQNGPFKSLITDSLMSYEFKGLNVLMQPSYHRVILNTNEKWAVPASADARRFAIFEVSPAKRGDTDYFTKLAAAIHGEEAQHFLHYLQNRDISKFNPAQLPRSPALVEQKIRSLTGVAKWLHNKLWICDAEETGKICHETWLSGSDDWRTLWPRKATSGHLFAQYRNFKKDDRYVHGPSGEAQFAKELKQILHSMTAKRESSGKRQRYNALPPLDEARRQFEEYLNCDDQHAIWGEDPEADAA